ncbi:MAG: SDR family NAD(P)-dependent oxidoreductase [Amylibacter sp.]|jgi:NAD(P)-dependent dehydrogenase (short-subunit alcohol dehydrogenase family)|tara:strand:- start:30254 stop:31087 length:834 start_codon:yes stop_codon:yes gene_type:complete
MTQKSILITGCSSGIGYEAAHTLSKRGWRVFATCRAEIDCTRLRREGLESFPLDYSNEESIKSAVCETLIRTNGTLDAVYNNGAYAIPGLVQDVPRDAYRAIFEVNLFGYFDLINQILPIMFNQGHGRIINCSSILGLTAMQARGAYNATKFAMEGLTDTLRLELKKSPIKIILIEPGPITADIRVKSQPHFERWINWNNSKNRLFYEKALIPRLYAKNTDIDLGELPPSAVIKKLIHALEAKNPHPRYYVTWPTHVAGALKRLLTTRALDWIKGRI